MKKTLFVGLVSACLFEVSAYACGAFFGPPESVVFSDTQHVLFEQNSSQTRVEYLVDFDSDAEEFGWIIPVPASIEDITEGNVSRFESIITSTQVYVNRYYAKSGMSCSYGCAESKMGGGDFAYDTGGPLLSSGVVGPFDYVQLDGGDAGAVENWLTENGWSVGSSGPAIEAYEDQDGFQFLALRLSKSNNPLDETAQAEDLNRAAIRIVYDSTEMRYPAMLSRYSSAESQRTSVYVVGGQRTTVEEWSFEQLPHIFGDIDDDPDQLYADAIWNIGGEKPSFALTYADAFWEYEEESFADYDPLTSGLWLSRFDAWVSRDAHTLDPVFVSNGGQTGKILRTTVELYEDEDERATQEGYSQLGILFFPALIGLWTHRRRRD